MQDQSSDRAGHYEKLGSFRSFKPKGLPPDPPLDSHRYQNLLSRADRAVARLDGASTTIPNPELFVYAFMRQEATVSSQIEGTQASLDDLFEHEAEAVAHSSLNDVGDIVNYIDAMRWGLSRVHEDDFPVSLRLIREMHERLLASGRGAGRNPGEFRDGQNHIGPEGCSLEDAVFVPPAVPSMHAALNDWEAFLHSRDLPVLIRCAVAHAQFETIHPFWDGNGRIGRMTVVLMLCSEEVLEQPVLYLSLFFSKYKQEYYAALQAVRDEGDWQRWVEFFLRGVTMTCRSALDTARRINRLREEMQSEVRSLGQSANNAHLADALFMNPYITAQNAASILGTSHQTGVNIIDRFQKAGILTMVSGRERNKTYVFTAYLDLLNSAADRLEEYV